MERDYTGKGQSQCQSAQEWGLLGRPSQGELIGLDWCCALTESWRGTLATCRASEGSMRVGSGGLLGGVCRSTVRPSVEPPWRLFKESVRRLAWVGIPEIRGLKSKSEPRLLDLSALLDMPDCAGPSWPAM